MRAKRCLKGERAMKKKNVTKLLALALTGAMLMTTPGAALAEQAHGWSNHAQHANVPTVQNLTVAFDKGDYSLKWTPVQLKDSQEMYLEYSSDPGFPNTNKTDYHWIDEEEALEGEYSYMPTMGVTTYYRMVIFDNALDSWASNKYVEARGGYSNTVQYTTEVGKPDFSVLVRKNSVSFDFEMEYNDFTGVEIYRAEGNAKYKKIATVTEDTYKDTGLKSETSYRYKVRGYVLDPVSGKKVVGKFVYRRATTWGSDLNVEAKAKNSKTVKLTWDKVKGATAYKIYRQAGSSVDLTISGGENKFYDNWKLIKTVKAKAKSYTDKKLKSDETYSYRVEAVNELKKNGKVTDTLVVSGMDSVTLGFEPFEGWREIENPDGSVKATWKKSNAAEGYKVYRERKVTDANGSTKYVEEEVASLPGTAKSYTFAALDTTVFDSEYTIYAFSGTDYRSSVVDAAAPKVARVETISAAPTADKTGITVSWAPVAGAAYYKVYRSRSMGSYNADKQSYNGVYGTTLQVMEKAGKLSADGTYYEEYPEYTEEIKATSVTDTLLAYAYRSGETTQVREVQKAPRQGVRYYYYVQAFAGNGKPIDDDGYEVYGSSRYSKPGSAMLNTVSVGKPVLKKLKAEKGKVTLSWKKAAGAEKYIVYYSTKKKSGYVFGGITTNNKITVKGLQSGKTHYFRVKAVRSNAAGGDVYSPLSKIKSVKVK